MPLVRIDLDESVPHDQRSAVTSGLHRAVVDALDEVPDEDDFQIVTVHAPGELIFHPTYAGPDPPVRRERVIYVQILIDGDHGREVKRRLYSNIARELAAVGIKQDEVFVALYTNGPDDWWAGSALDS
jgi:4-oxalocrotonate tautomerase